MNENFYIPEKLTVGFQNRQDTFTGKLAFVTYVDDKGLFRQEKSWNQWRDKSIKPIEIDNTPMPNFVLNKGEHRSHSFSSYSSNTYIRIYDPRGFEFEITVDNLMHLLEHSDVSKKDIVQDCVYAWSGTRLVLLPINSKQYIDAVTQTKNSKEKLSTKDLKEGQVYYYKKGDNELVYLGYMNFYVKDYNKDLTKIIQISKGKKHMFYNNIFKNFEAVSIDKIYTKQENSEDFAKLKERFLNSISGCAIKELRFIKKDIDIERAMQENANGSKYVIEYNGQYRGIYKYHEYNKGKIY